MSFVGGGCSGQIQDKDPKVLFLELRLRSGPPREGARRCPSSIQESPAVAVIRITKLDAHYLALSLSAIWFNKL